MVNIFLLGLSKSYQEYKTQPNIYLLQPYRFYTEQGGLPVHPLYKNLPLFRHDTLGNKYPAIIKIFLLRSSSFLVSGPVVALTIGVVGSGYIFVVGVFPKVSVPVLFLGYV